MCPAGISQGPREIEGRQADTFRSRLEDVAPVQKTGSRVRGSAGLPWEQGRRRGAASQADERTLEAIGRHCNVHGRTSDGHTCNSAPACPSVTEGGDREEGQEGVGSPEGSVAEEYEMLPLHMRVISILKWNAGKARGPLTKEPGHDARG